MAGHTAHKLDEKERTGDIKIGENVDFASMYLSDPVFKGLQSCGFIRPSPIQLAALPIGRCGLDLVVQAKSGTGKTLVFTVIALEMVSVRARTTQVLIMAPTREIAVQIAQVVNSVGSFMPELRAATFIGGINLAQDKAQLQCCHIVIGTPGRLTQLVELGVLKLDNTRLFVLDEADSLLSGQFKEVIMKYASFLPHNKQVLCLSATFPEEVAEVAKKLMRSPVEVRLNRDAPALLGIRQFVRLVPYHPVPHQRQLIKFNELLSVLSSVTFSQCLVFSNSQLRAESVCGQLKSRGWPANYLSGGQSQAERLKSLDALCTYKCRVLVSTDLAARGLDSEHVNLVINLDLPADQATYLHRIGRAGRFGSHGSALSIVSEGDEWESVRAIASLANVRVYIIEGDEWKSGIVQSDSLSMSIVPYLEEDVLAQWIEKQNIYAQMQKKKYKDLPNMHAPYDELDQLVLQKCTRTENIKVKENGEILYYDAQTGISNDHMGTVAETEHKKALQTLQSKLLDNSYACDAKACFQKTLEDCKQKWPWVSAENDLILIYPVLMKEKLDKKVKVHLLSFLNSKKCSPGRKIDSINNFELVDLLQQVVEGISLEGKRYNTEKASGSDEGKVCTQTSSYSTHSAKSCEGKDKVPDDSVINPRYKCLDDQSHIPSNILSSVHSDASATRSRQTGKNKDHRKKHMPITSMQGQYTQAKSSQCEKLKRSKKSKKTLSAHPDQYMGSPGNGDTATAKMFISSRQNYPNSYQSRTYQDESSFEHSYRMRALSYVSHAQQLRP